MQLRNAIGRIQDRPLVEAAQDVVPAPSTLTFYKRSYIILKLEMRHSELSAPTIGRNDGTGRLARATLPVLRYKSTEAQAPATVATVARDVRDGQACYDLTEGDEAGSAGRGHRRNISRAVAAGDKS